MADDGETTEVVEYREDGDPSLSRKSPGRTLYERVTIERGVRSRTKMAELRAAFPDLDFRGVGDLIAEGDYVFGRRDDGRTHTGPAFDIPVCALPAASGRRMRFTGTTVFCMKDGKIIE